MSQNNDLQSAIPSHYELSNGNIDFEDAGRVIGGPLLSAVAAIIGGDESDAAGVLRTYSEEHDVGVLDAALVCIVSKSDEADANIAGTAMRSLLSDELVEPPAVIAQDEVYREIVDDDGIYDRVSAVASQLPDSLCARVADLVDRRSELDARIVEADNKYDNDMATAEDNEDYNSFVFIQNEYDETLADVAAGREELAAEIKSVRAEILAISGDKVEAREQQLVEKIVNTDYDPRDTGTIRNVEREVKDYSFATDFLEVNKFRIDPQAVLEVFSDKLKDFVSSNDEKSPYVVETIADCLASIKDEIVSRFADTVADKVDDVVRGAIDGGKEERVSIFVDKVSSVFETVVDRAQSGGVDVGSVKLSNDVAEKLESLRDKGVSDKDIASIEDVAKALDAVFEGYSDLLKTVLVECATEADAKVERDEDAVAVASDDEEDGDEVDKDDDADTSESDEMDSGVFEVVENVAESISDIVDGFERIERDDQDCDDVDRDDDRVD